MITHSLKLLHSFTDCLQTLGTLCREGNKDHLPSKRLDALLSLLFLQDELLVLCESFFEASVLRDAECDFVHLFFSCNPAGVSTTHFKFVFKCIINSIFPSSPVLHLFVGLFLKIIALNVILILLLQYLMGFSY